MKTCSKCGVAHERSHRYCAACHAGYMRTWRRAHPLTAIQRMKDNSRSYARVMKKRGKLVQQNCEICGSEHSEMHHEDYSRPIDVQWLCRDCHLHLHHSKDDFNIAPRGAILKAA